MKRPPRSWIRLPSALEQRTSIPPVFGFRAIVLGLAGISGLVFSSLGGGREPSRILITCAGVSLIGVGLFLLARRQRRLVDMLSEAATTDPLTELLNRRAFQARMDQELARAQRDDLSLSLVIGDLDDFKHINDRLGHQEGDRALERVSNVISGSLRTSDTAARLGGEEFAIILPGATAPHALAVAERLRTRLEDSFDSSGVPLTISVGIAVFPDHGGNTEELLGAADAAMYVSKALGKNRCTIRHAEVEELMVPRR